MNTDVRYYSALIDDFMGERIEDRQKEWSKYETLWLTDRGQAREGTSKQHLG